jgi:hypothetical protein
MFPNKMKIKTLEHAKTNGSFGVFGSEESPDRLAYQPVTVIFSRNESISKQTSVFFFWYTSPFALWTKNLSNGPALEKSIRLPRVKYRPIDRPCFD